MRMLTNSAKWEQISLISAFVVCYLDSSIPLLSIAIISILQLVFIAERPEK